MTNHVHLLVTPDNMTVCALLMRDLAGSYASYFNRRHGRSGTLWQGRFGSCLVDSALYVLGTYRYIERNPVRAGMIPGPLDYEWSSAGANVGISPGNELTRHPEYLGLGNEDRARHRAYRVLLDMGDDTAVVKSLREATGSGYPLVGAALKAQLAMRGSRIERGKPGPRKEKLSE